MAPFGLRGKLCDAVPALAHPTAVPDPGSPPRFTLHGNAKEELPCSVLQAPNAPHVLSIFSPGRAGAAVGGKAELAWPVELCENGG